MRIAPTNPPPRAGNAGPPASAIAPASTVEYVEEVVVLSPLARSVLWYTVLLLIVSNALVLGVFSLVYAQNEQYHSLLWTLRLFFLYGDATAFLYRFSMSFAVGYGILSATFAAIAVRMIAKALPRSPLRVRERFLRIAKSTRRFSASNVFAQRKRRVPAKHLGTRVLDAIVRARRSIGVRGPYFEPRVILEEWFELGTQSVAAYSASRSISNISLNITYAVVIFLNSISTIVFTRIFPRSLVKQRLACVIADLLLDFVWGTLLPVWMYVPIIQRYMTSGSILADLVNYAGFTRTVQRILMLTWKSYAVSVIPFFSSLLKLLDLQTILRELRPHIRRTIIGPTEAPALVHVGRRKHGWFLRVAHGIMPLYGLAVLLLSLTANDIFYSKNKQLAVPCGYRVHPWFSTRESCLQRKINCTTLRISGATDEIGQILNAFDRSTLSDVHFINCPALEMPSSIREFPSLLSMVIINTTIVTWNASATLSDPYFSNLCNVQLYHVRFVHDPVGLTGEREPLATSLEWIHLEGVDGPRILSRVGSNWRHLQALGCIDCHLTAFPSNIIDELPHLRILSLRINGIPTIPDDWLRRRALRLEMVWFDSNPRLTELPDLVWRQAASCGIFSVPHTNLSVVPAWLPDVASSGFQVTANGSPVCNDVDQMRPRLRSLFSCT